MKYGFGYLRFKMIQSLIYCKGVMFALVLGTAAMFFLTACGKSADSYAEPSPVPVINVITATSILEDWVNRVGGEHVNVHSIIPLNADPHTFRPTPTQIGQMEESDIIFLIGEGYEENWLSKLSSNLVSKQVKLVHLSESVNLLKYKKDEEEGHHDDEEEGHHDEEEGHHDDEEEEGHHDDEEEGHHDDEEEGHHEGHKHGTFDPHFWHDPLTAIDAINEITRNLSTLNVSKKSVFTKNATIYVNELTSLDKWIGSEVSKVPSEKRLLVTNHQTMGYFANRYGFRILGTLVESLSTDKNHTIKGMITIMDKIRDNGLNAVFSEMQIPDKIAKTVSEETNATIVPLYSESLGAPGSDSDTYVKMMRSNVNSIVNGLNNSL